MKSEIKIAMWSATVLITCAALSCATTMHYGENDWPAAALRITVLNAAGVPVQGASFSIFKDKSPAVEFQQAFLLSQSWTSDKDGAIDLLVKPLRYKVFRCRLFWVFPIRHSDVDFEARVIASGFNPTRMTFRTLLDNAIVMGRRPVDEGEAKRGFGFSDLDILRAIVILESGG